MANLLWAVVVYPLLVRGNMYRHAPVRCGRPQAQDAEERLLAALEDKAGAKRLGELRKVLLSKEQKMRALREALVKLKQVRAGAWGACHMIPKRVESDERIISKSIFVAGYVLMVTVPRSSGKGVTAVIRCPPPPWHDIFCVFSSTFGRMICRL